MEPNNAGRRACERLTRGLSLRLGLEAASSFVCDARTRELRPTICLKYGVTGTGEETSARRGVLVR